MDSKFDDALFDILKEVKTIPHFFDTIFGFLYRRTDFYNIAEDPNIGVGLPVGVAENCVKKSFFKYAHANKLLEKPDTSAQDNKTEEMPLIEEQVIETTSVNKKPLTMDTYNGAALENYCWSQSITDVDIQVKIPENLTSKQLSVNITPTNLCVKLKNSEQMILEGDLCKKCKNQETIWSIDGCFLQIHLEKCQEMWWDCFLTSEDKIDLSRMDCSRPFHELSEEAQVKIEELTWNQERKRQGLPTSDQLKLEETLKKAWNAEGSPFSGEYDPSKVKLN